MEQKSKLIFSKSTDDEIAFIEKALIAYNEKNGPFPVGELPIPLNYNIKDKSGKIIAGVNALFYRYISYIDILWVDEAYRGKGLGKQLYNKVEEEAHKLGAKLLTLDTLEFQAKDFYVKLGFEIYSVLENFPPGHTKYSLKKNI